MERDENSKYQKLRLILGRKAKTINLSMQKLSTMSIDSEELN
jgi:hypothetical protein